MSRIAFFIDGFNLFHALDYFPSGPDHSRYNRYKWISLARLARCFVTKKDRAEELLYFTTLATWNPEKVVRHKLFIKAQEAEGVQVVYGEFKRKERRCPLCNKHFWTFEEKQTDVNIALRLFELAVKDRYDRAIIVSGDTDLLPAIKAVRSAFPAKQIGVVIPIGRASEDLKKQADFYHKMKEKHLVSSRLPDVMKLSDGTELVCPPTWR
ncbi:MAG: NYN domain-containing protein [Candidatus Acidiferrales bacterium]